MNLTDRQLVMTVRWVLFAAMAFNVPLVYYMFVVGGVLSFAAIVTVTVSGIADKFLLVILVNLVHLVVYGVLLYLLAENVAQRICRHSRRGAVTGFVICIVTLTGIGLLPIFGFFGHGPHEALNAYESLIRSWREI